MIKQEKTIFGAMLGAIVAVILMAGVTITLLAGQPVGDPTTYETQPVPEVNYDIKAEMPDEYKLPDINDSVFDDEKTESEKAI